MDRVSVEIGGARDEMPWGLPRAAIVRRPDEIDVILRIRAFGIGEVYIPGERTVRGVGGDLLMVDAVIAKDEVRRIPGDAAVGRTKDVEAASMLRLWTQAHRDEERRAAARVGDLRVAARVHPLMRRLARKDDVSPEKAAVVRVPGNGSPTRLGDRCTNEVPRTRRVGGDVGLEVGRVALAIPTKLGTDEDSWRGRGGGDQQQWGGRASEGPASGL